MNKHILAQFERLREDGYKYQSNPKSIKKGRKTLTIQDLTNELFPIVGGQDAFAIATGVVNKFEENKSISKDMKSNNASEQARKVRRYFDNPDTVVFRRQDDSEKIRILVNNRTWQTDVMLVSVLKDFLMESGIDKEMVDDMIKSKTLAGIDRYLPYQPSKIKNDQNDLFQILNTFQPTPHFFSKSRIINECPKITKLFFEHLFVEKDQIIAVLDWLKNGLVQRNKIIQLWVDSGGTGKTTFINSIINPLYGPQNIAANVNQDSITTRYNASYIKQVVNINEVELKTGSLVNLMKGLTEDTIYSEEKNSKRREIENPCNIIISSNNKDGFAATTDERRYCILQMTDIDLKDAKDIFDAMEQPYTELSKFDMLKEKLAEESEEFYWFLKNTHKITTSLSKGFKNIVQLEELEMEGILDWQVIIDRKLEEMYIEKKLKETTIGSIVSWLLPQIDRTRLGGRLIRDYLRKPYFNDRFKVKAQKPEDKLEEIMVVYKKDFPKDNGKFEKVDIKKTMNLNDVVKKYSVANNNDSLVRQDNEKRK